MLVKKKHFKIVVQKSICVKGFFDRGIRKVYKREDLKRLKSSQLRVCISTQKISLGLNKCFYVLNTTKTLRVRFGIFI